MRIEPKRKDWVVFIRLLKTVTFCLWDTAVCLVKVSESLNGVVSDISWRWPLRLWGEDGPVWVPGKDFG